MSLYHTEKLLELKLWPVAPFSPQIAFTIDLIEVIHSLILKCQVSLHDIAKMVGMLSPLHMHLNSLQFYIIG